MEWISYSRHPRVVVQLAAEKRRLPVLRGLEVGTRATSLSTPSTSSSKSAAMPVEVPRTSADRLERRCASTWREHGMRNSNTMAIAPTATIGNIAGCLPVHRADLQEHLRQGQHQRRVHRSSNGYLIDDLKEARSVGRPEMLEQAQVPTTATWSASPRCPTSSQAQVSSEAFDDRSDGLPASSRPCAAKWIDQSAVAQRLPQGHLRQARYSDDLHQRPGGWASRRPTTCALWPSQPDREVDGGGLEVRLHPEAASRRRRRRPGRRRAGNAGRARSSAASTTPNARRASSATQCERPVTPADSFRAPRRSAEHEALGSCSE